MSEKPSKHQEEKKPDYPDSFLLNLRAKYPKPDMVGQFVNAALAHTMKHHEPNEGKAREKLARYFLYWETHF